MDARIREMSRVMKVTEEIFKLNGSDIYESEAKNGWGVYVNGVTHAITIHSPESKKWQIASGVPHRSLVPENPHVFMSPRSEKGKKEKPNRNYDNDMWIGGFRDFAVAYAFADLFKKLMLILEGFDMSLSVGTRTKVKIPSNLKLYR